MLLSNETSKLFIWVAHPHADSLNASLATAYQRGAEQAGAEVRRQDLADMNVDNSFNGYQKGATLSNPDLLRWQQNLVWADHVVFVFPYWWGGMPAKAKAVLDQSLLPKFAFKYHRRGMSWDKLLRGRTGDVIVTSDTVPWLDTLVYGKPGRRVIKNQVLDFCGIKPKKVVQYGSVKLAKPRKVEQWLEQAERMGETSVKRSRRKWFDWRNPNKHYPMTISESV